MLFFSKKETIVVGHCECCKADITEVREADSKEVITPAKFKTADNKYLCASCLARYNCTPDKAKEETTDEIYANSKKINENILLPDEFHASKIIYGLYCLSDDEPKVGRVITMAIDEDNQKILFSHMESRGLFSLPKIKETTRDMSALVDFELLDSGNTKISGASLLGSMAGGVVGGGIGALIGSNMRDKKVKEKCTNLVLKIIFNDMTNPEEYIRFVDPSGHGMGRNMNRQSKGYLEIVKLAQQCVSLLTIVMKRNKDTLAAKENTPGVSSVSSDTSIIIETIKKLGDLHNTGVLTDEEFSEKKAELLSRI